MVEGYGKNLEPERILNARAGISPEMALRLEAWIDEERGGRASLWLGMQNDYDLWHTKKKMEKELALIKRVVIPK